MSKATLAADARKLAQSRYPFNDAHEELRYILAINPKAPGDTFNNDPACFARYVAMQADKCQRCDYVNTAAAMRTHVL